MFYFFLGLSISIVLRTRTHTAIRCEQETVIIKDGWMAYLVVNSV